MASNHITPDGQQAKIAELNAIREQVQIGTVSAPKFRHEVAQAQRQGYQVPAEWLR